MKSWFPKPFILKALTQWQLWQLPQKPWFLLAKARLKDKLQMSRVEILSSRWDLFKTNTNLPGSVTAEKCCSVQRDQKLKSRDLPFFPMKPKVWMMSQILAMSLQVPPLLPAQPQLRLRHLLLQGPWQPSRKVRHTWGLEITPRAQDTSHAVLSLTMAPLHLSKWLLHLQQWNNPVRKNTKTDCLC